MEKPNHNFFLEEPPMRLVTMHVAISLLHPPNHQDYNIPNNHGRLIFNAYDHVNLKSNEEEVSSIKKTLDM